jgi:Asp-tRNA(Asn)/Glu-tRNA(Gln) amidotransferase B subunit
MNLVELATIIQAGYRKFYDNIRKENNYHYGRKTVQDYVFGYVMLNMKGHCNPQTIRTLVELETSVPDQYGTVQC